MEFVIGLNPRTNDSSPRFLFQVLISRINLSGKLHVIPDRPKQNGCALNRDPFATPRLGYGLGRDSISYDLRIFSLNMLPHREPFK